MDEDASFEVKEAGKMMVKRVFGGEVDMDQESTGSSSEEMESPRSVVKVMRRSWSDNKEKNTAGIVHSQILRIRYEDSHIGEDFSIEVLNLFTKADGKQQYQFPSSLVVFSKPILPASPLGGKTLIKSSD